MAKKLMTKTISGKDAHIFQCDICYEMSRRGYYDEDVYFEDLFHGKLNPIKYKLQMVVDKKTFDKWLVCLNPKYE